jgi:hypothetical protein
MDDPANAEDKTGSSHWPATALCLLPLIYVLSVGPAVCATQHGLISEPVLDIYAPLGWLARHTPLQEPLELYLEFWESIWPS